MRKGLIFKKGIIIALAAAVVTSLAPVLDVSGWGVMNAKAEETTEITVAENAPQYLYVGDNTTIAVIWDGKLQDDGKDNKNTIYQGNSWYYDSEENQLVLQDVSITNLSCDGDLTILLSGTNTVNDYIQIEPGIRETEHTLKIKGDNNGSLICENILAGSSDKIRNLSIMEATVETSLISSNGSLMIEDSHIVVTNNEIFDAISGKDISIINSYVDAKTTNTYGFGKAIVSDQKISVSDSQVVAGSAEKDILSDCDFSNSVITKQWKDIDTGDDVTKTYVYGKAALKEDLMIASGESIEFESSASITNLDKLIVEDGATILIDGAEHKHNTNGDITYIWQDDKEHTKGVACKDCPIGYVTKETETHNIGENGFCMLCDAYQPAVLTTDKYDINEDGTKDAVYEISNAGQLYWFAGLVNGTLSGEAQNTSANAVLAADIVVNENVLKSDGTLNEGTFKEWTPIGTDGTSSNVYTGTFDGRKYTISGLYFNQEAHHIGLFGANSGKIANVGILDSYFYGQPYRGNWVGGVCGYNTNQGAITNCYNTGIVRGSDAVGGVCGSNYGIITNCSNTGNVGENDDSVGGVSGNNYGTITNCNNAGIVSGNSYVGGVCGKNYNGGTVTNCNNTGEVEGTSYYIGGLSGDNDRSSITNCNNTGKVRATGSHVGGLSGGNYNSGTIANCYYDSTIYTGAAIGDDKGTTTKVEGKTTEQYKTGEVAYLLQEGQTEEAWGQTIGTDTYPVLRGAKVYKNNVYSGCNDLSDVVSVIYSNEDKPTYGDHDFVDGECRYCGEKAAATVTISETITYYQSLQDAIDYAEKMPGCVVTALADMNDGILSVDNSKADFTIDINGYVFSSGIAIKEGKITITDSRTGGDIVDEIETYDNSTLTIGDVKISGDILSMGNLILNGGDLNLIIQESRKKIYFNNSDIKISEGIRLYGDVSPDVLVVNAEPHNIIPIVLRENLVNMDNTYAVAGDGITLQKDWFAISATHCELDFIADIRDNKLKATALLNDRIKVEFEKNETFTYSGNELRPSVNVYYNRYRLDPIRMNEGSNYTLSYADNTNAGTATITLTGIGNFSGTKNVTFTIEPKKPDSPTIAGLKAEYTYTGQKIEPEFTLMDGDTVIPSSEYEVAYSDNTEVGTATVSIIGIAGGNYDINYKAEFDIVKIDTVINELPVADAVSYDPNKTLGAINISGGNVLDPSGKNVPGSWSWADTSVVPTVDNSGYDVVFTPDEQEHYNPVSGTIQVNVSKADVNVVDLPVASAITYGDALAKSVISGGRVYFDGIDRVEIPGTFAWEDDSIKPFVSDSDKTLYTVVFTPADSVNYNTTEIEITVNVSKAAMPNLLLSVDNTHKTVGSIALPGDWTWLDMDAKTAIKAGGSVVATAVYVGDDKENYDSTELKITIYRAACSEGKTVKYTLKGEKAPTCTKSGTGHTECSVCGDVMSTGVYVKELGHKWNSGRVTRKPTYTATGVKTFTCTVCKATKTGSIAKLATTDISKKTSKITVSGIENKIYNGKVHTQKSLVVKAGAKTLRLNKDYTVTYSKNKAVGKASVIIRGKNAYSGKITKTFAIVKAAKGKTYTVGKFKYTITGAKADGTGTVAIAGTTYSRSDKKFTSLTISDAIVIGDVKFKITSVGANAFSRYSMLTSVVIGNNVTSIGSNAFVSCKNLKKMTIKSAKLKSVGAKAFSGTYSKITFAVPRNKAKAYKKLIKKGSPSAKAIYK